MRLGSPSTARPDYKDRNAVARTLTCNTTFAATPAAATVRATYTVPAGKKAFIEYVDIVIVNLSTTATNSDAALQLLISTTTDGSQVAGVAWIPPAQAKDSAFFGGAGLLVAGESVQLRDFSNSSAGNVISRGAIKLTEFDA